MNPRLAAFRFSEAIAPVGRPMPVVPIIRGGGPEGRDRYLRGWSEWQERAQTDIERRGVLREGRADSWGGMMQDAPAVVVVDIDDLDAFVRSHPQAAARYAEEVVTPVQVVTARGRHLYFRIPPGAQAPRLATQLGGFDMKGARGLVFLPGSLHRNKCHRYALLVDEAPADPCDFKPGELHALLPAFPLAEHLADLQRIGHRADAVARPVQPRREADDVFLPDDEALARARQYLAAAGPAVAGEGGHVKTRGLLLRLGDLGVADHVAHEAAHEWNEGNVPPWSARDLADRVRDAYKSRTRPVGCDLGHGIVVDGV